MNIKAIKKLRAKIANGDITVEEKILLFKELNANIESMRRDVAVLKDNLNISKIRKNIFGLKK